MKKILALLLALMLIFTLAACGEKPTGDNEATNNNEAHNEQQEELPAASTKTLGYFQKFLSGGEYTMEMKTTADGIEMTSKNAYSGDMIYSESDYNGQKSVMVMRDGYQYIIDHTSKSVIKMQVVDNAAVMDMFSDEATNYETALASGTTEYNGKTYEYEEFNLADEKVQYLFDNNELKVMKASVMGIESIVEIISIEKGADASLFEIPKDYQTISY